jgi:hypothetical protein
MITISGSGLTMASQSYHNRTENKMIRQLILKNIMHINVNLQALEAVLLLIQREII